MLYVCGQSGRNTPCCTGAAIDELRAQLKDVQRECGKAVALVQS
jgi:hypothetical protein